MQLLYNNFEVNARAFQTGNTPTSLFFDPPSLFTYDNFTFYYLDDLVSEKERYKDIGDDLDIAFVELILKE